MRRSFHIVKRHISSIVPIQCIRNVGIIAHIDAGKTTATERILYYSGYTNTIGDVDDGNTVTDYLPQERERGITIQSAVIPLLWKNHRINLIDTPGHVDFTIEVERSVRILDGGVLLIDAVSGVEAQTETVWKQANFNSLPRIAFINKMDREGASLTKSVESITKRLKKWGKNCIIQWPLLLNDSRCLRGYGSGGQEFEGIIDLVRLKVLSFKSHSTGSVVTYFTIEEYKATLPSQVKLQFFDDAIFESLNQRRIMIDTLAEYDDAILESLIELEEDYLKVPMELIQTSIRTLTLSGHIMPILCGSAFKNIGIQPLLDSITSYLPSPLDRSPPTAQYKTESIIIKHDNPTFSALAFKILMNDQKGPVTFLRVYSGSLTPNMQLTNTRTKKQTRPSKILQMYANDYEELNRLDSGDIAACTGLIGTQTGDTLVSGKQFFEFDSVRIPVACVRCTIAPSQSSELPKFELALKGLLLEDPSLQILEVEGDLVLAGMGDLHLEVSIEKLKRQYRVNVERGKVCVGFVESCLGGEENYILDQELFGKKVYAGIGLKLSQIENDEQEFVNVPRLEEGGGNIIIFDGIFDEIQTEKNSLYKEAIENGIKGALSSGPNHLPVTNLRATVTSVDISGITTTASLRAAAFKVTQNIIKHSRFVLFEPVMDLSVRVPEQYVGIVTKDISGKLRGYVLSLESEEDTGDVGYTSVEARAPLRHLVGYVSHLRAITKGSGQMNMKLKGFSRVSEDKMESVIRDMRGY